MKSPAHHGRTQAVHVPRLEVATALQVDLRRGSKERSVVHHGLAGSCMLKFANSGTFRRTRMDTLS